ncbi:SusC/RagA family TonB-linked outer membrane protein [Paraflavitalea pollutisoli]|uniref:SusC/RagA family TonB-linked outer membrane protein n=1 Tax=Paraflavitalea pollutisoli TaxID=3034143 RepID=UPI0023ED6FBB|nr:SusC/RagA family TonB-linked outer membrane protein [Paraflavitalea sp. H1-2-19X]
MRMTTFLLLGICLHVSAGTMSQVTLSEKNVPIQTVFRKIREQTGYTFVYRNDWLQEAHPVTIDVNNASLRTVLDLCFKGQPFTWETVRNTVVLRRKEEADPETAAPATAPPVLKGKVVDDKGKPIVGASVVVRGTKIGVVTKADGSFEIDGGSDNLTLVISYVGFTARSVKVKDGEVPAIVLSPSDTNLQDMVVTGITTRRKESFTGATASFNNAQIKAIGNQNVIQSLRSLDPSFILTENNTLGSNPNQLPDVEIRGKTSITNNTLRSQFAADPNQPLFILDGFEAKLRTIVDLDINRIESVTLLKDAASTAIYGARAANGVVVVETRRPKAGRMQVSYTGDFKLELPDLSGYNLMNGEEKLEFERLSGRYTVYHPSLIEQQLYLDSLYSSRLTRVRRGVNTYWLNEPVQPGFSHGHSIRAEGSDNVISYIAGLQFKQTDGVLKGSGRKTWQGNVDLFYKKNKVSITNRTMVNGYTAVESPYGSFNIFAEANPYYEKYNAGGGVDKYLEVSYNRNIRSERIVNPLWNATLNNYNNTKGMLVQNNLQFGYQFNNDLNLLAGIQLSKSTEDAVTYKAPEHTDFDDKGIFEKGRHTNQRLNSFIYQANAMLTYNHLFGDRHQLNGTVRMEAQENKDEVYFSESVGFPSGSNGNPAFAYGYAPNGRPNTFYNQFRRNNFLASASYTYDKRFVVDFSYRMDGSTAFGSGKMYSPFWSVGGAWNLHREKFFADKPWIEVLRLKANTGATGNQNFGQITSVSVYSYERMINLFGQGTTLATLGNPDLEWQKTLQTNIGLDFTLLAGKLTGFINAFEKNTDPLIVQLDLPSSTGIYGFPRNVGHQINRGLEANIRYTPIRQNRHGVNWSIGLTGIMQKAVFGGLGKQLEGLNKTQEESKQLDRYKDGYSADDLWAVYSYGIDPASGREIFRKLDGTMTYDYDAADVVVVGNRRPVVEGVMSSAFAWKGFSLGIVIRYQYGGDIMNDALFTKVENIDNNNVMNNQDKRALYDRWKKAGDVTQFRAISITADTKMSSRFIQEENTLSAESVRVGYDFSNRGFIKRVGMKSLSLNAYLNDVFRISTVRRERGIEYPFARVISFSIATTF